jgi:hypothetical protein
MVVFIVLWPYLLTTKLRCLQKNNIGHTIVRILIFNFNLTNFFSALNPVIYGFMSKSFRTSFRKTVCNCQLYAKNEEPIATQWEHEGKGEEVEIQPQICCNHRNTAVLTNNHGLRINHSRGALNRYVVRMNMTLI